METTLTIDNKQVTFKSTAGTVRRYRNQFGQDFFADIVKMYPLMKTLSSGAEMDKLAYEDMKQLDFSAFENIAWALAKTADNSIKSPDAWFDDFDSFPIADILPEIQELIFHSLQGKKKV
jgi:hypothetical protein